MSCCGGPPGPIDTTPVGEHKEGDVRAQALWGGNRPEMGRITGRRYPRTSWPHYVWMDERDAKAAPNLWQIVPDLDAEEELEEEAESEPLKGVMALEARLMDRGLLRKPVVVRAPLSRVPVAPVPNFRRVKRLAGVAEGLPIFVKPRSFYPSYLDFWHLVELSGFEWRYTDEINLGDPVRTYIFVTPEGIPDCTNAQARTIFWQFEYAGDYTNQPNRETAREQWSSDPAHAKRTDAQYVLLGSHPGLNPNLKRADEMLYDCTMLAYLTKRREQIKDRLREYRWSPDYPGHEGVERHEVLRSTKVMIHVHQHEEAACAPIRYALAAAYKLPVIAEDVPDRGLYYNSIVFTSTDDLVRVAKHAIENEPPSQALRAGPNLYELLCVSRTFDREVLAALGNAVEAAKAA